MFHLVNRIDTRDDKYEIAENISIDTGLERIIKQAEDYDGVIIGDIPARARNQLMKLCYARNIRSYTVPKISDILLRTSVELNIFDSPLYLSRNDGGLAWDQAVVKRIEDIIVAGAMLLVTSPFFLIIAFLIWNTDKGPIFYTQERLTKDGKIFRIYKFRTDDRRCGKEKRTGKSGRKRSPYSSGRTVLTRNAYGRASAAVKHPQRRYEPGRTETGTGRSSRKLSQKISRSSSIA